MDANIIVILLTPKSKTLFLHSLNFNLYLEYAERLIMIFNFLPAYE